MARSKSSSAEKEKAPKAGAEKPLSGPTSTVQPDAVAVAPDKPSIADLAALEAPGAMTEAGKLLDELDAATDAWTSGVAALAAGQGAPDVRVLRAKKVAAKQAVNKLEQTAMNSVELVRIERAKVKEAKAE